MVITLIIGGILPGRPASTQRDIDRIHDWSNTWQMSFNPFKCKALHFSRKNPCNTYTIAGESIGNLSQERDLIVLIRGDLDWDAHVLKS